MWRDWGVSWIVEALSTSVSRAHISTVVYQPVRPLRSMRFLSLRSSRGGYASDCSGDEISRMLAPEVVEAGYGRGGIQQ
jgi:hypothetical protein